MPTNRSGKQYQLGASPIQVQEYLKNMRYPGDKAALIAHAKKQGAPENVMSVLEALPDQTYTSPTDVSQAIGALS